MTAMSKFIIINNGKMGQDVLNMLKHVNGVFLIISLIKTSRDNYYIKFFINKSSQFRHSKFRINSIISFWGLCMWQKFAEVTFQL
jgi:hypothetical protein